MAQPCHDGAAEIVELLPERRPRGGRQLLSSCPSRATAGALLGALAVGGLLLAGPLGASRRQPQSAADGASRAWSGGGPAQAAVDASLALDATTAYRDAKKASDTQVRWATCVIDVHQAIFYLAQAGTFIKFATLDCPNTTDREDRLACAADVSVVANSFLWTAAYVAASINSCNATQNVDVACAASITGVLAELAEFAFVAVSVVEVCELDDGHDDGKNRSHKHPHPMPPAMGKLKLPSPAEVAKLFKPKHNSPPPAGSKPKLPSPAEVAKLLKPKHHSPPPAGSKPKLPSPAEVAKLLKPKYHPVPPAGTKPKLPSPAEVAKLLAPKASSPPPAGTKPKLPSPAEAAKLIAKSAAKVRGTVQKYRQEKQLQGKGKTRRLGQVPGMAAWPQKMPKASLMKEPVFTDGLKVADWLEHMKEAQDKGKKKPAAAAAKSNKTSGRKTGAANGDDGRRGARVAQCGIDANLGLSFLARAGLQIYALTHSCPSWEKDDAKLCAIDIFNVISSFAWAAQFLAQMAVDCPEIGRDGAACAAVVADFVAIIAALGPLVNGVADDCPWYHGKYDNRTPGQLPVGYADFFGA